MPLIDLFKQAVKDAKPVQSKAPAPVMGPPAPTQSFQPTPTKAPAPTVKIIPQTPAKGLSSFVGPPVPTQSFAPVYGPPVPTKEEEKKAYTERNTRLMEDVKKTDPVRLAKVGLKGWWEGTAYVGSQIDKGFGFASEERKQEAQARYENALRTIEYYIPDTAKTIPERVAYGLGSSAPNLTLIAASGGGIAAIGERTAAKTALGKSAQMLIAAADTGVSFSVPTLLTENRSWENFKNDFLTGATFHAAGQVLNKVGAGVFGYGTTGQRMLNIQGQGMVNAIQSYQQGANTEDIIVSFLQGAILEMGIGTTKKQNLAILNQRIAEGVGMKNTDFIKTNGKINPEAIRSLAKTLAKGGTAPGFVDLGAFSGKEDYPSGPEDISWDKPEDTKPEDYPPEKPKLSFKKGKDTVPEDYSDTVLSTKKFQLTTEQKTKLDVDLESMRGTLEKASGKAVTHEDVLVAAKEAEAFKGVFGREKSLEFEAKLTKARQLLTEEAKKGEITPRLIELSKTVKSYASFAGRLLGVHNVEIQGAEDNLMMKLIGKMEKAGADLDGLVEQAKGVDFNDYNQATDFYRKHVKATVGEMLSEFRYANLLSSPKTHIVNTFSNAFQGFVLEPIAKTADIAYENVASFLTGKERQRFFSEVPSYYKNALSSMPKAFGEAINVIRGNRKMTNLDLQHIPTKAKILKPFQVVTRALEAMDVFFQTAIGSGETGALNLAARKVGAPENTADIASKVDTFSKKALFRNELDTTNKTGQGKILSGIDTITNAILEVRKKVPGTGWIIPFVKTPMNILKRGFEYSPLGYTNMVGNTRKSEQVVRSTIGSLVTVAAASLAFNGQTTWGVPTDTKERELFYASGRQPYSIKVGDRWYSYSKLGPIAYPLAMGAAVGYYWNDNKTAQTDSTLDKIGSVLGGTVGFFSDQSYVQSIGNLIDSIQGDKKIENIIGSVATQYVPLSSLLRWVDGMVDPIFRKTGKGMEGVIDNIKKGIPGLSQSLEPYTDPKGNPSKKPFPEINALSPVQVSQEDEAYAKEYRTTIEGKKAKAVLESVKEEKDTPIKKKAADIFNRFQNDEITKAEAKKELSSQGKEVRDEYKKLEKSSKTKDTLKSQMEVYPYVQDYIELRKAGEKDAASSLYNSLTNDQKKNLKKLYEKYK